MTTQHEIRLATTGCADMSQLLGWLQRHFPVCILPPERFREADFLICDTFNSVYERYRGVRILVTWENHPADLANFDYCLTHDKREDDRRMYLPYWMLSSLFNAERRRALTEPRTPVTADQLRAQNRKFCAFVVRNHVCKARNNLVKHLMPHKQVSCGGPLMNNIGYLVDDKIAFMAQHLFGVAYENESSPGYLTEKLADALQARCIPLYWGDETVEDTFNPKAFLHARRFKDEAAFIQYILELSEDYERMADILNQPPLLNPRALDEAEACLLAFFTRIFERGPEAIRRTRLQRLQAFLRHFYGHGLFRSFRTISRRLRHKE